MNEELRSIYLADQAEREEGPIDPGIAARDQIRRHRVQALLLAGEVHTADDFFHAAMVFQHGPDLPDYCLAGELAGRAVELGHVGQAWWCSAGWLVAAAHDRGLMCQGEAQKYGTQFLRRGPEGPLELWEVDSTTTDDERAALNVPPLADALAYAEGRIHRARPRGTD